MTQPPTISCPPALPPSLPHGRRISEDPEAKRLLEEYVFSFSFGDDGFVSFSVGGPHGKKFSSQVGGATGGVAGKQGLRTLPSWVQQDGAPAKSACLPAWVATCHSCLPVQPTATASVVPSAPAMPLGAGRQRQVPGLPADADADTDYTDAREGKPGPSRSCVLTLEARDVTWPGAWQLRTHSLLACNSPPLRPTPALRHPTPGAPVHTLAHTVSAAAALGCPSHPCPNPTVGSTLTAPPWSPPPHPTAS